MSQEWQTLTRLTGGGAVVVERVKLVENGVAIEGQFELPPLARLSADDQVFVAAFVRCHGSIKQMEKYFGVSYPTIKNRLNRIGALLPFAEMTPGDPAPGGPAPISELLSRLERGEINVNDVLSRLRKAEDDHE